MLHELWMRKGGPVYVYDENLTCFNNFTVEGEVITIYVSDCNDGNDYECNMTQTLFNDDDSFEYIQPVKSEEQSVCGIKVMSDSGKELARVMFDAGQNFSGHGVEVMHIGTKDYLFIDYIQNADGEIFSTKIYLIKKSSNGENAIQEVNAPEVLKAMPSLARRNQSVNIELGENAGNQLQVTSSNGSVVRRLPIKPGQKTVQLSTRGLSSGLYVVSTVGANGTQENCKIVVK